MVLQKINLLILLIGEIFQTNRLQLKVKLNRLKKGLISSLNFITLLLQ